ncbi:MULTISPECIES: hypothetical protein [Pseudoalteromonas]|nr:MULTISPECIES: hypothetical protein [Pseudoalteromonas]
MPKVILSLLTFIMMFTAHANAAKNTTLHIKIMTDFAPQLDNSPQNIATGMMLKLEQQLNGAVSLTFIPASRLREWQQLHKFTDVCLYNKVKNPEREKNALFNRYPIMAFPSNRLVVLNHPELPKDITLSDAINKHKLTIGITKGRSYGEKIDAFIAANSDAFMPLPGTTSALRLSHMLFQNKIDAIIEYSAVFISRHSKDPRMSNIRYLTINKVEQAIFGYIACSPSKEGKKAINLFDTALQEPSIFKDIIDVHKAAFPHTEQAVLIRALEKAYKQ